MESTAPPPEAASRTMTETPEGTPSREPTPAVGVLRLRGGPARRQRVVWAKETIDNEGMGKKKSKICCIYHKPRAFDESSSESDSCSDDEHCDHSENAGSSRQRAQVPSAQVEESSDESDGGAGDGRARPARRPKKKHEHSSKANKYDSKGKEKA